MTELIDFLRARLDEDEQIALAVDDDSEPWPGEWKSEAGQALRTYNGWVLVYPHQDAPLRRGLVDHIARHDPAQVLREVEAKRQIIQRYETAVEIVGSSIAPFTRGQDDGYIQGCFDAIRDAAAVHSDHPDYRDEWRP